MELLSQARQTDPNMQVIIITGDASLETAIEAVNKGAFGYLTKPFDHMSVFANTVRRALEYLRLTLDNLRMAAAHKRRADLLEAAQKHPLVANHILFGLTRAVSERLQAAGQEISRLRAQLAELEAARSDAPAADS